ncbi:MAG: hypothetical protein HY076_04470, partial [Candidatus Eisenbacteria bacterium]|nr:hypothetical protein [Candidatus Eisenbacteria bacterium]
MVALCAAAAVTFQLFDTDFWQHLLVGRVIWERHAVPTRELWSWPTYGAPDLNASWGFEALIWPLWSAGGVLGLYLWRWGSVIATFAIAVAAARRMGARGVTPLLVAAIAAIASRQRSQVRPESVAALMLAIEILLLESRRAGRRVPALAVVPVLWIWVNTHVSYHLGFITLGAYAIDETITRRRASALWLAVPIGLAVGLLNPFGWHALWEPFRYFLFDRKEKIFTMIGELQPIVWSINWRNGVPLLAAGWPLLALARLTRGARRGGVAGPGAPRFDLAELLLCAAFVTLTVGGVRFIGMLAVAAVPFMSRDLAEWTARGPGARAPLPIAVRAAVASLAAIAALALEWSGSDFVPGVGIEWRSYPVAACDAIAARGLRGRFFNYYHSGGYPLFRFWPDPGRLPFMDIHATGTRDDRRAFIAAERDPAAWRSFAEAMRFDIALLTRPAPAGDRIADFLDADTSWALVFLDDAAVIFVRRRGADAAVAARDAYALVPAGNARAALLGAAVVRDPALRARVRAELERQLRES